MHILHPGNSRKPPFGRCASTGLLIRDAGISFFEWLLVRYLVTLMSKISSFGGVVKEPLHFCTSCLDYKKGIVFNSVRKDIVRMDSLVGNEYRNCSAAGGMPVDRLI